MKRNRLLNNGSKSVTDQNSLPQKKSFEGTESSARLPWNYSPPTLKVEGADHFPLIYSTEVNLTIQLKVKEFTRKQATLLAGQALYQVLNEGLTLGDWMTLEFLYSYLLGQKLEPLKVKNPKELELLLLLKLILLSGTWIGLEGKSKLPEDVRSLCLNSKWVPNSRTYSSRKVLFSFERFLSVRIVPIDTLIERSKTGNERYSSYCKGYGESSHMGRRQKTRISSELDGEEVNFERIESEKIPFDLYPLLFSLNLLESKYTKKK